MRERVRNAVPWVVAGIVAVGLAYQQQWFGLGRDAPSLSGPARDVALTGGGVSDGSRCGAKGYHYFTLSAVMDTDGMLPGTPVGPQMILNAYGGQSGSNDPGDLTIALSLSTGSASHQLDLSAPLGPLGVAVEIEGPNGLVGGAHNVPVTLDDPSARLSNGKIRVGDPDGFSAEVKIPAMALCPGNDVTTVAGKLKPPTDSSSTITGQPPYTLTVSISDPAVAVLRTRLGSTVAGPVLAANNFVPR